jgi:serine/threonine-protein kinase
VFVVAHPSGGRSAVKVLRAAGVTAEWAESAARAAAARPHPNVVACRRASADRHAAYWEMEYLHGVTLGGLVRGAGRVRPEVAVHYARQLALGLGHLHQHGLVHADLKPDNVMLAADGTVKLIDVDAAFLRATARSADGAAFGTDLSTPAFAPPERVREPKRVGVRTDVYGLGAVVYFLLTGRAPCPPRPGVGQLLWLLTSDPASARERVPGLPAGLTEVVHRMLARDPAERFGSMAEVVASLAPCAPPLGGAGVVHEAVPRV